MPKLNLALQLYTVRDMAETDLPGTLQKVARIGYAGVELAGFGNLKTARDVKKAVDDVGLKICGAHDGIDELEKDLPKCLAKHTELGNRNICVPWLSDDRRKGAAGWKATAQSLSRIGKQVRAAGFEFAYHNHSFEFEKFDGVSGFDILWSTSDPDALKAELDVYWLQHGGVDPVSYINKLGKRTMLLHLKDMAAGPEQKFAPVGTGILDFKAILEAGSKSGVTWGIVEQDNCYGMPTIESAKISFQNLQALNA